MFDVGLSKFRNNQSLLYKISHRFLVTTKLFRKWKILIEHFVLVIYVMVFLCIQLFSYVGNVAKSELSYKLVEQI